MEKLISIIIVTYNSESDIFNCLDSIYKYNDIGEQLEVIVVDNNSFQVDEMFKQMQEKYGNLVACYKNTMNGGYGQGNNLGISLSHAPYILIMNPDVRLIMPVFRRALECFRKRSVAMVGMVQMISMEKRGTSFSVQTHRTAFRRYFQGIICNRLLLYLYKSMYLAGACFFIRKDVFYEIGQFDENIFLYGEENDLHLRLRKIKPKMKIVFEKKLRYLHLIGERPFSEKSLKCRYDSNMYVFEKHGLTGRSFLKKERNRLMIANCVMSVWGKPKKAWRENKEFVYLKNKIKEYGRN